jgi:hypothetical protein
MENIAEIIQDFTEVTTDGQTIRMVFGYDLEGKAIYLEIEHNDTVEEPLYIPREDNEEEPPF